MRLDPNGSQSSWLSGHRLLAALTQHWKGLTDKGAEARVDHKPGFRLLAQCSGWVGMEAVNGGVVSGGCERRVRWAAHGSLPGFSFSICRMGMRM